MMNRKLHRPFSFLLLPLLLVLGGCQSAYYSTMEKFGVEKRDILVDRVEDARDAQEDTKEQFADALEEFSALIEFDGGDLERLYDRLKDQLEASEASARRIRDRIDEVRRVAGDLFSEWEDELDQFSNETYRRQSRQRLDETRRAYQNLIARMERAEGKIPPVLQAFRDQVLFLKHNLNAQAIAALEDEAITIQEDVRALIAEMEAAINEANTFLDNLR